MKQQLNVGQVWQDCDGRIQDHQQRRNVRIVTIGKTYAIVENTITNRRTTIRLNRFKATGNGYRLVKG